MVEAKREKPDSMQEQEVPAERDLLLAEEIACFIAERAFEFEDHECRAWSLTDFGVWAKLCGREPELSFASRQHEDE